MERPGRTELGRFLLESRAMSSDWAPAFAAVDRALFLPALMWPHDMETGKSVAVSRNDDPEAWYGYADQDIPIVTQWDDGKHHGREPGTVSTSSSSMPSLVYGLLAELDVQQGMSALDIGTGTGETAGLLTHRVGHGNVTTVDIDPAVSRRARERLSAVGLCPNVVEGDGLRAALPGGPFDRTLITCGIRNFGNVVSEMAEGGVIVAPWGTHYSHADAVARLVVERGTAGGHFTRPAEFMKARSQRGPAIVHGHYLGSVDEGDRTTTEVTEDAFTTAKFGPVHFAVGLRVRDIVKSVADKRNGARPVWFYGPSDKSWACVMFRDGAETAVWQGGPRRLWDEVEAAFRWWLENGRPAHDRFGLTVTPDAQRAWLDDPGNSWAIR
ncbi:methyltransferase domain-containing protein [Streptomyces sp. NPDC000410]|uniref:methyltransferase domain-containing protein n=1 Tax=Streptomyces sp. NPDC000410 TaxID=3154254 RepID=UPI0033285E16